jgi:hypothetical protein
MKLFVLSQDKANHIVYGTIIFNAALCLAILFGIGSELLIASIAVIAFAFGKELVDYIRNKIDIGNGRFPNHTVDWLDAAATIFGGILAILPIYILG